MKRLVILGVMLAMVLGSGCEELKIQQASSAPEVYWVMIDGVPNIFDAAVYRNGVAVGEIQATDISPLQVTRLAVAIRPEYRDQITTHTVFYIATGRLNADVLSHAGAPLAPGAAILGFSSKLSLQWFKARTALSQTDRAAAETAKALYAGMGDPSAAAH